LRKRNSPGYSLYFSLELQLYFDPVDSGLSALASGLFDTIGLFRQLSTEQEKYVMDWLRYLDCMVDGSRLCLFWSQLKLCEPLSGGFSGLYPPNPPTGKGENDVTN
jgi:hypothetical protein